MDGASKFVRGDAIAGILILVHQHRRRPRHRHARARHRRSATPRASTRCSPSATAWSRRSRRCCCRPRSPSSSRACRAPQDMGRRARHPAVRPAARRSQWPRCCSACWALIPGMPNVRLPAGRGGAGRRRVGPAAARAGAAAAAPPTAAPELAAPAAEQRELSWDDVQPVDLIGLEVGYPPDPAGGQQQGGELLGRIKGVRRKLSQELGFLVQAVHIRDNLDSRRTATASLLSGVPVGEGDDLPGARPRDQSRARLRQAAAASRRATRPSAWRRCGSSRPARAGADARLHRGRRQHRDRDAPESDHPDACARAARPRGSAAAARTAWRRPRRSWSRTWCRRRCRSASSCACCRICSPSACRPQHAHHRRDAGRARRAHAGPDAAAGAGARRPRAPDRAGHRRQRRRSCR